MRRSRLMAYALLFSLSAGAGIVTGCTRSFTLEEDGGPPRFDAGTDSALPTDTGVDTAVTLPGGECLAPAKVDLLFVVDNSNSMTDAQVSLAESLPAFLDALLVPPDDDGDGEPDYPPVDDVRIGVVTTDMGTGGFAIPTCTDSGFGDDGVLRAEGNTAIAGCPTDLPAFLPFRAPEDVRDFAQEANCALVAGTGGCGFEQPLEAALKAVTPRASTVTFAEGTRGHADGANAGFLRPDSMLGVVVVTDEEDCSVSDPEVFNPVSEIAVGDLNLRCFRYPDMIHPLERYRHGFRALRPRRPDLFTFAVIAGIPADLAGDGVTEAAALDRILEDPLMEERLDPDNPNRLAPSCSRPSGGGAAFPPPRLVGLARQLAGQSVVASICQDDWTAPMATIGRTMGRRACAEYGPD